MGNKNIRMIGCIDTCYQCPDRKLGCHGICVKYIDAKRKADQIKQKRMEAIRERSSDIDTSRRIQKLQKEGRL